jgi:hypothetical protein
VPYQYGPESHPEGLDFIVATADQGTVEPVPLNRIDRITYTVDGAFTETLATAAEFGLASFKSVVVADEGEEMWILAHRLRDPLDAESDLLTTLWQSLDGGATWDRHGEIVGAYAAIAVVEGELVIWRSTRSSSGADSEVTAREFRRYPSMRPIDGPVGSTGVPFVGESGAGLWWFTDGSRILSTDGTEVVRLRDQRLMASGSGPLSAGVRRMADGGFMSIWRGGSCDPDPARSCVTVLEPDGALRANYVGRYALAGPANVMNLMLVEAAFPPSVCESVGVPPRPCGLWLGTLEVDTGTIFPIVDPFFDAAFRDRRGLRLLAVVPS